MGSFQEDLGVHPGEGMDGGASTCRGLGKKKKIILGEKQRWFLTQSSEIAARCCSGRGCKLKLPRLYHKQCERAEGCGLAADKLSWPPASCSIRVVV